MTVVLLAFAMFANAQSPYTIDVLATLGPNYFGSPSYDTFAANVIAGIQNGDTSGGSGPTAFNFISNSSGLIGTIAPNQPIVSSFESWQGTAPGPYAGETGTRLYFALHITAANDALFSLSQLSYSETDPPDLYPTETYGFSYSGSDYATDLVGRQGATWIDSGAGTQLVSELIYVGEFVGWEPNPPVHWQQSGGSERRSRLPRGFRRPVYHRYVLLGERCWRRAAMAPAVPTCSSRVVAFPNQVLSPWQPWVSRPCCLCAASIVSHRTLIPYSSL